MNVKDLGNRIVLITGADSGIGRQLALPCARPASAPAGERGNGHA
jgi:NAD(P)-dependent dehydrogenase (short-subunit alcohol dehydrogenase family)